MATKALHVLVIYKNVPADKLAMANTEINLDDVPEGQVRRNKFG